jgi:hypothetical protein
MHGPTGIFWANLTPFSLEAVMCIGVVATEPKCAQLVANSKLISGLQQVSLEQFCAV